MPAAADESDCRGPLPRVESKGWRPRVGALLAVASFAVLFSGWSGSAWAATKPTTSPPSRSVVVPSGWNSYTYGKAKISVPSGWAVYRETNCGYSPQGWLTLGFPKILASCQALAVSRNDVFVTSLAGSNPNRAIPLGSKTAIVNGVRVYIAPRSHDSAEWVVPTLDVLIDATGPASNAVLHTLRSA
jgi:hypothetical protein